MPTPGLGGDAARSPSAVIGTWAPERSARTEETYTTRFEGLQKRYRQHCGLSTRESIDVHDFANWVVDEAATLKANTRRHIRAVLKYGLERYGTPEATDALTEAVSRFSALPTSASPARDNTNTDNVSDKYVIRDVERDQLIAAARETRSSFSIGLPLFLLSSLATGLRPHEWLDATLQDTVPQFLNGVDMNDLRAGDNLTPEDIEAWQTASGPWLLVRNAKFSNDRACGEFRALSLGHLRDTAPTHLAAIQDWLETLAGIKQASPVERDAAVTYEKLLRSMRKFNLRLQRRIWGRQRFHPYAARHTFAARLKKSYGAVQIAALMGHASTRTARQHYGRMKTDTHTQVGSLPVPDPRNILIVRHSMKATMAPPDAQATKIGRIGEDSNHPKAGPR
jgi:integrase